MTPEADTVTLEDLRRRVTDIDRQLIALVAERKAVSEEVARVKRATGRPTRDYEREREVILGVRAAASERGVSPALAEQLLRLLIRSSLTTQEQASVVARGAGTGRLALKSHGCKVTSVHPMFGPDTELLSGRHVVFVDLGNEAALTGARELFASTMAEQVVMSLDEHDRLIAYVLGLSHALNIAFFTALAESGEAAPRLARMSSTTFDAQLEVASHVAQESPELYYEIQSLNDYGAESLEALSKAVERLRTSV